MDPVRFHQLCLVYKQSVHQLTFFPKSRQVLAQTSWYVSRGLWHLLLAPNLLSQACRLRGNSIHPGIAAKTGQTLGDGACSQW